MSPSHDPWLIDPNPAPASTLHPERALLTPAWVASLAALGVNDHLLKGAGVLPDALTGKLSDVAGMLVAPALLAALTRTRSRRGLFLCHLAVGAVFAAINLSHEAASLWSALMGAVAVPWQITTDPLDLLALPALYLSWRLLTPAMARPLPARPLRALEGALAGTGLALCVATSPATPDFDENFQPFQADAFVYNNTDHDVIVRVRELDPTIQIDCEAIAASPDETLSEAVFGPTLTWTVLPGAAARARGGEWELDTSADCYAVLVEADTMPTTMLFWERGELEVQWLARAPLEDEEIRGSITITDDGDDALAVEVFPADLVVRPADLDDPKDGACAPQADGERLAWSQLPGLAQVRIAEVDVGPDGCIAVDFGDEASSLTDWYVCMDPALFPFAAGEWVSLYDGGDFLHLKRIADPVDPQPIVQAELKLFTTATTPAPFDVIVSLRPDESCGLAPDACGTVARSATLSATRIGGETLGVAVGQAVSFPGEKSTVDLKLVHAQERVVVASECSEGPEGLGADIELIATLRGNP